MLSKMFLWDESLKPPAERGSGRCRSGSRDSTLVGKRPRGVQQGRGWRGGVGWLIRETLLSRPRATFRHRSGQEPGDREGE